MGLLRNNALLDHPYLKGFPADPEGWYKFVQALNAQSVEASAISGSIEVVAALPTLPDASYPVGSVVFLETDDKLYRNTDGSTWSRAVDGNDITADTIQTNSLAAGAVTAAKINVSQLSAISADMGTLTTGEINLSSGTGVIRSGQTAYDTGTGYFLERNGGTPRLSIGNSAGNKVTWNGTTLSVVGSVSGTIDAASLNGLVALANSNVAAQGWTTTTVFSATDADTVAWAAGTFTTAAGTAYSISGSNTGNMAARTYIYLDIGVSTTAFQTTTTAATAVGSGKVLVAVAQNSSGSQSAYFQVFGGIGGQLLTANELSANSVVTNTLAASSVTSGKISVSQLSAISADMGTLTTGEINLSSGTGVIRSGQTAYDTGTGYYLERNGGTPRLSIGNSAGNKLTWNGSELAITGAMNFTNSVQTFTPTWTGFSSSPSGDLYYISFGAFALVWSTGSALVGTSNSTTMTITNLPAAITPASAGTKTTTLLLDNGITTLGYSNPTSGGSIIFSLFETGAAGPTGGNYIDVGGGSQFTNSGNKGLSLGWMIMYTLL